MSVVLVIEPLQNFKVPAEESTSPNVPFSAVHFCMRLIISIRKRGVIFGLKFICISHCLVFIYLPLKGSTRSVSVAFGESLSSLSRYPYLSGAKTKFFRPFYSDSLHLRSKNLTRLPFSLHLLLLLLTKQKTPKDGKV